MNNSNVSVAVVTIMYGNRWIFLSKMIESVLADYHVKKLIIVDNGSENEKEIIDGTLKYGDRVVVLRQEKNLGSAGGFAVGIEYSRTLDCDFVFLSDDDMVMGDSFVNDYLKVRDFFGDRKVVISGHRYTVPGNSSEFYKQTLSNTNRDLTFFEIFSMSKIKNFFDLLFRKKKKDSKIFVPIIPTKGFVYGGAFIPMKAIREAPLPDKKLFLYGDDVAYSWGIEKLGYNCYASSIPLIKDIDVTFEDSHIFGLFSSKVAPFKIFYRIRNMVILSLKYSNKPKIITYISIFIWIMGLLILGLTKEGPTLNYFKKGSVIIKATYFGLKNKKNIPNGFPA